MNVSFVKMEGAGNDYVYVDALAADIPLERLADAVVSIADRHFGVGGDGVIALGPSRVADCRMIMWNADGSRGAMCGNGLRCVAALAHELGHAPAVMTVETDSGVRRAEVLGRDGDTARVAVDLGVVRIAAAPRHVTLEGRLWTYRAGDAGNPHAVIFYEGDLQGAPVAAVGAAMQTRADFPDGVNVEFVRVVADGMLEQRTFERGSGETLACGSGAAAAVVAALDTGRCRGPRVTVRLAGGELIFIRRGSSLVMEGPSRTVFRGTIVL